MENILEKFTMEKQPSSIFRAFFNAEEKNRKQETLSIEMTVCDRGNHDKNKFPEKWIHIQTYVTDSEGTCREIYNPTIEPYEHGLKLKDDMIFEATEENVKKLLETTYNLFMSVTGKSATELKMERINEFAKERNLPIFKEIPKGWYEMFSMSYPKGCSRIVNCNKFTHIDGKFSVNPNYKEAIYIY